jgi:eukaryotic-like serine/threonine-protein kinase
MTVTSMMGILAVVPLIPLIPPLLAVCGWLLLTLISAVAALRHPGKMRLVLRFCWRQKIGLAVLSGIAVGVFFLVSALFSDGEADQRSASPGLPERTGRDWPEYRGGITRLGATPGSDGPSSGKTLWTGGSGYSFYACPAVDGDRVYGCGFKGNSGRIFCWNADTGELLWTVSPPDYDATVSSPVLSGDLLVIGEGLHDTVRGRIFALDLRAGYEGETVWEFTTRGHVESTPTVRDGRVYVAVGDDGVYCLSLRRDVAIEDRLIWHSFGTRYPDVEASLPVVGNRVFACLGRGGNAICVLDAETGRERNRTGTRFPVFSTPAISDGKVVFGMGEGDYRNSGAGPGEVWCLDTQSLKPVWKFDAGSTVLDAVAVRDRRVFCGTAEGRVFALDLTDGSVLAGASLSGPVVTAPAVTKNHVFVVTENGRAFCLDAATLKVVWQQRLPDAGLCFSSPVVDGTRLFVGTSGGFFALGTKTPSPHNEEAASQ